MKNGIRNLRRFLTQEYPLFEWSAKQSDQVRRFPRIPASAIFLVPVFQAMQGVRSLLQMDQLGRSQWVTQELGRQGSDTLWLTVLRRWKLEPAQDALFHLHQLLKARGQASLTLSSGRIVTPALVDGSCMGGFHFSVLTMGGKVEHLLSVEPSPGQGHELRISRRLLRRICKKLGKEFASHLLLDGLYANAPFLKFAHEELEIPVVIKRQEKKLTDPPERLEILESTQAAWSGLSAAQLQAIGVEVADWVDAARALQYHVLAQGGIAWEGLPFTLKVAHVYKTALKGPDAGQTTCFWVLSTDENLTARELAELAVYRWTIENNTFKELSEQVGSKRAYIQDQTVKTALLLLWGLGLALLKTFTQWLETIPAWAHLGVRKTKKLFTYALWVEVAEEALLDWAAP